MGWMWMEASVTGKIFSRPPTNVVYTLWLVDCNLGIMTNQLVKASLKEVGVAVVVTAASAMLASNAMAIEVLHGGDDGSLAFVPNSFTVSAGEKITLKNNAGFPHNVVFDEDEIPSGVDASAISMSEEDLLNGPGEAYSVTLKEKGIYSFYCSPHQGAGMVGKVTVN